MKAIIRLKGGAGSGHFDHAGRPGLVGGSVSSGGSDMTLVKARHIVDNLAKRFGMPNIDVVESDAKWTAAHISSGNRININPRLIDNLREYPDDFALPVNQSEIIIHEYGHIIHSELSFNPLYGHHKLGANAALRNAADVSWGESLTSKLDGIARRDGMRLSEYATKNAEEYFAEAFVAYVRGKSWHDKINPEVLTIFRDLDNMVETAP